MHDGTDTFYQMLMDCYGIWSWEYDRNQDLVYTNSPSQYFHGKLLLGRGRGQTIQEQGCAGDAPLIISNSIGTMWAVVFGKGEDGQPERYFAIGPVFTGEMSPQSFEQAAEPLNLPLDRKWALIDCMNQIPYVATTTFFHYTIMLHYYVTGKKVRISDFVYHTQRQTKAVLIGISNELPEYDEKYELHRLLSTLLSMELNVDEKMRTIQKEYGVVVDDRMRKDVSAMCNLSQGIRDAENEKIIMNMHRDGYSSEQKARIVEKTIDEVEAVIRKREPILA